MEGVPVLVFWVATAILGWTWVGYPLALLAATLPRPRTEKHEGTGDTPVVTIIVAAHNEEAVIQGRIENCLALDYPPDRWELIVVSDHSMDGTETAVAECRDPRVRLLVATGRGKSLAQNEAVGQAQGEIIVFSDADTRFRQDFLREVVAPFAEPTTGAVAAGLVWTNPGASGVAGGGSLYWRFEHLLWRLESRLGVLAWASGACMAFRRELFTPIEPQYGDDCVVPLGIVAQGYRVVFHPEAVAHEPRIASAGAEFRARTRMTLRSLTGTLSRFPALQPLRRPGVTLAVVSHKLLRWLTPYVLVLLFLSNLLLLGRQPYDLGLALQGLFYACALLGALNLPLAAAAYAFCVMNAGIFVGVGRAVLGHRVLAFRSEA